MTTAAQLRKDVIVPTLMTLPHSLRGEQAAVLLLAIAAQESGVSHRDRKGAQTWGMWQLDKGMVTRVLKTPITAALAADACDTHAVKPDAAAVMRMGNDSLACAFAALILYAEPAPLPFVGDEAGSWEVYRRNWGGGEQARARWDQAYSMALRAVINL